MTEPRHAVNEDDDPFKQHHNVELKEPEFDPVPAAVAKPPEIIDAPVQAAVPQAEIDAAVQKAFENVDPYAPTQWGLREKKEFDFTTPSGQKVLLKKLDPIDLIECDLVDEMDYFSKKLFPNELDKAGNPIEKPESEDQTSLWELLKDPEKRQHFFTLINGMCVAGVLKPAIVASKDEQGIFVGDIEFNDRMAIFTELQKPVGRIGSFRQEQAASVEPVESSQSV